LDAISISILEILITRNIYLIFNYNIHIEIASDQYCLLINTSYNLINYSCILIIFISFKYIKYLFIICSIVSLFIYYLFIFNILRDLLRELDKKYEILLIIFYLLFIFILLSELLLFISFFWISFHSISSISFSNFNFYLVDPCQLTFINTILLSNASISLGNSFIFLEISSTYFILFIYISSYISLLFIYLQIKEFSIISLFINDSIYNCLFFFITGLHFFHIFIGNFILFIYYWIFSFHLLICK